MYLFGSFPLLSFLLFSLSLSLFSFLLPVVQPASASETNRLGLTGLLLQWGRGKVCTMRGGQGLNKIWMRISNKGYGQGAHNTARMAKNMVGWRYWMMSMSLYRMDDDTASNKIQSVWVKEAAGLQS